jgi:hypothetical protein
LNAFLLHFCSFGIAIVDMDYLLFRTYENICGHVVKCTPVAQAAITADKEDESVPNHGNGDGTLEK